MALFVSIRSAGVKNHLADHASRSCRRAKGHSHRLCSPSARRITKPPWRPIADGHRPGRVGALQLQSASSYGCFCAGGRRLPRQCRPPPSAPPAPHRHALRYGLLADARTRPHLQPEQPSSPSSSSVPTGSLQSLNVPGPTPWVCCPFHRRDLRVALRNRPAHFLFGAEVVKAVRQRDGAQPPSCPSSESSSHPRLRTRS